MGNTMRSAVSSGPVRDLDRIRPDGAAAKVDSPTRSDGSPTRSDARFTKAVADAIVAHYGSVKAAAISLGGVDESLMMREFKKGNFRLLERADAVALGFIAGKVRREFPESDPKAEARRLIRDARVRLDELAELLEVS